MRVEIMARNVKLFREEKCWTQADLEYATKVGGKVGVSRPTIKRIEDEPGYYNSTSYVASTLASALGVSLDDLMVPIHPKMYDIGGEMMMELFSDASDDQLRADLEKIIEMRKQSREIRARSAALAQSQKTKPSDPE